MNTQAPSARRAPASTARTATPHGEPTGTAEDMARRLAGLSASALPWLSSEALAALADAPDVLGPPAYEKPTGWR